MKRDWDLIREILIAVEDTSRLTANSIASYDAETVSYHIQLLNQSNLVRNNLLTWEGHEFLDKIRQQSAWNRIKGTIKNKGLDLSYEALKIALGAVITNTF